MDKKRIGIGLLGTGFMGRTHSNAYKTIPYMFWPNNFEIELIAISDIDQERADESARRYGFKRGYGGWERLKDDPDVTIFDNCGPDPMHYLPTMAAIEAGKNVYCEKPLAMNAKDAKAMYEAAKNAGVKNMAGFNYRFFPANRLARELIQKGALGQLCHFRGSYTQPYGTGADLPYEKIWYNNTGQADGTGQAIGCHVIDLSRFLMGEAAAIMGSSKTYVPCRTNKHGQKIEMHCEEGMLGIVDFAGGASGIYEALETAAGRRNYFVWEVLGTDGSMEWNLENPNYLRVYLKDTTVKEVTGFTEVSVTQSEAGHPFSDVWWPKGHNIGWEHGHINAIAHFIDCVANDRAVAPLGGTFEDGYKAEVILEAIKQSSRDGRRIDLTY
jgi:predicted dehydrogenase